MEGLRFLIVAEWKYLVGSSDALVSRSEASGVP